MFHLKVKDCVDRILLFNDNNEYIGEMTCTDPEAGEKIFNGTLEHSDIKLINAVFLCYALGESLIEAKNLFSVPTNENGSDTVKNFICVNYYKPECSTENIDDPIASAKFCLLDIPERLQLGLGLPSIIILQLAEFKVKPSDENMLQRGLDPKASGYFVKPVEHLVAKSSLDDEKIKINLYASSIIKKLDITTI
jgi:hypothetical protein